MSMHLVVVIPTLAPRHREAIAAAARRLDCEVSFFPDAETALPALREAEIVFGAGPALTRNAPKLRWFCTPQAGVNQYLAADAFASPDAVMTNSSGAYGTTIAEHTVMVTLELMRRQPEYTAIAARREWTRDLPVHSIRDSRVTLLGTGDIGREAAIRLRAFSPKRLVGVNRSGRALGEPFDAAYPVGRLDELLPETDLLVLSLPGTADTERLLDERRLSLLPADAFLVNVGRGSAVDQAALERLMRAGHLAGAALDVFEREPLPPEDTLWSCPRVLITPHAAGNMTLPYTVDRIVALFLENLDNYAAGRPLARLVDRSRGY